MKNNEKKKTSSKVNYNNKKANNNIIKIKTDFDSKNLIYTKKGKN